MGQFKDRMVEDLRLKGYAESTQEAYVRHARKFVAHFMKPPTELGAEEVRSFFVKLVNDGSSASVRKMYTASVRFLYEVTLKKPEVVADLPYPKVPRPVPEVLDATEVLALLDAMKVLKHQVAVMTAYAAGLRVGEVCALEVRDIDARRKVIHVRDGKGGKGRYTMLSERLLWALREYWAAARPPGPYLFPSRRDPSRPMPCATLQSAVRKAASAAGLSKRVTPHTLRHTFATHLLAMGADIRQIQLVLGHCSIQTTARYTHMSRRHIAAVASPLDAVGTQEGALLG